MGGGGGCLEFCSLLIDEIVRFIKFVYNTLNACLVMKILAIGQYDGFCNPSSKCSALKDHRMNWHCQKTQINKQNKYPLVKR